MLTNGSDLNVSGFGKYMGDQIVHGVTLSQGLGFRYMHGLGVLHRDIKPDNCMLTKQDPQLADLKVIDFGLSVIFEPTKAHTATDLSGTVQCIQLSQTTAF